jgi:hypothetical protein
MLEQKLEDLPVGESVSFLSESRMPENGLSGSMSGE